MQLYDFLIVGSGPAACGALKAIPKAGKQILVIDIGLDVQSRSISVEELKRTAYELHDVASKTLFGQKTPTSGLTQPVIGTSIASSEMLGGHSNLWGGVCERLSKEMLKEIGITVEDPDAFYASVTDLIPNQIRIPEASSATVSDYMRNEANDGSWRWPSLACNLTACIGCKMCFYGCSLGLIHDFRSQFVGCSKGCDYIQGSVLLLEEENEAVLVTYKVLVTGVHRTVVAKKVLLGAGPVESCKILARSTKSSINFELRDNAYTIFPFISGRCGNSRNTLCELESNKELNGVMTKAQLYTGSPYICNQIKKTFRIGNFFSKLIDQFFSRIGLLQVFVDSDRSRSIVFTYDANSDSFSASESGKNIGARWLFKLYFSDVLKLRSLLIPFANRPPVLSSMHFGAVRFFRNSEELAPSPTDGSIDLVKNVHMIDASVFKKIPACSPTQTIVANAYRIAVEVSK